MRKKTVITEIDRSPAAEPSSLEQQIFFLNLLNNPTIPGELISQGPYNALFKVAYAGKYYYVKRYYQGGRYLRKYVGRSRARAEQENLALFQHCGILTPSLIFFREIRHGWNHRSALLVTQEVTNTADLATLWSLQSPYFNDAAWVDKVSRQVAAGTQCLHRQAFVHNDLKWRNILVSREDEPKVYFIDCPAGKKRGKLFRFRGQIKDLACLDKVAKRALSNTQRLRFYYYYAGIHRLTAEHKTTIRKIVEFF